MTTISERIIQFNSDRIPEYTSMKYSMMAASPFRFFRGGCHLFYEDLSKEDILSKHPLTWICGDLHLENFGSFKGNNRLIYFDLNDFDEAVLAPASWELARMATSILTGFESLQISGSIALRMAKLFLQVYAETLSKGKALYIEPETAKGIVRNFLDTVCERKQKTLLRQRAVLGNKKASLITNNTQSFAIPSKEKKELILHLTKWIKDNPHVTNPYRVVDVNFRVAGTGSVGLKRYVFLVQNSKTTKKYLLLDMKQAKKSSLQPYLDEIQPSWSSEADRIVAIQDRMQNIAPALLGTTRYQDDSYVLRELQPTADKIDFLVIKRRPDDIVQVIEDMARLTASAQLRSSGRQNAAVADALIAFGKDPEWQQAILDYSLLYSRQVKKDYQSFLGDFKKGLFSSQKSSS